MARRRGKGKISNDLVAASCMAVLAVYAAGYTRTRDAARRFELQAKERRTGARAEHRPVIRQPAAIPMPAPQSAPDTKATAGTVLALVDAPKAKAPVAARKPATKKAPSQVAAVEEKESPVPGGVPEIAPVPLPPQDAGPMPIAISRDPATASAARWRDGTYTGLGDSPHGDIEARVVIRDGRIVEAGIASCETRYPCSVIDPLIHQPVDRQSPDVDYMSHATESSDAYYYALVAALENALERPATEATSPK